MRIRTLLFVMSLCIWSAFTTASLAAQENSGEALTLLADISRRTSDYESIQAEFVQEKHLSIFQETLVSKGRFAIQPGGALFWAYSDPIASGFLVQGDSGKRWNELAGVEEDFTIADDPIMAAVVDQLRVWSGVDAERLTEDYDITLLDRNALVFKLLPRRKMIQGFIESIIIRFAESGAALQEVDVREPGGDSTQITFTNIRFNKPFPSPPF